VEYLAKRRCYLDGGFSLTSRAERLGIEIRRGLEALTTPGRVTAANLEIDSNLGRQARMGRDPKTSVVNFDCQSHEVPRWFIGGASVSPLLSPEPWVRL
jgi:choline dehydrogenase-like flavoprotein